VPAERPLRSTSSSDHERHLGGVGGTNRR
jgi:hypothetical protein